MERTAILHIGLHKTGTTALQELLRQHPEALREQGFAFYSSMMGTGNHTELGLAALRDEIETFDTRRFRIADKAAFRQQVRENIANFVAAADCPNLIFSSEGLSLARTPAECQRLRDLFVPLIDRFRIIFVKRDASDYLDSLRKEIVKSGNLVSFQQNSVFSVRNQTWLTDFESIERCYREVFGDVSVHSYQRNGMLDVLLKDIGVELNFVESDFVINESMPPARYRWSVARIAAVRACRSLGLEVPLKRVLRR